MDMTEVKRLRAPAQSGGAGFQPVLPRTISDLGLPEVFLNGLVLRVLYSLGDCSTQRLAQKMAIPAPVLRSLLHRLRVARLVEPLKSGEEGDGELWGLTAMGRSRAVESRSASAYVGPVPVTIEAYRRSVLDQAAEPTPSPSDIESALADLALDSDTCDRLGAAVASQRSFVVHGPPGSGRSSLVGKLALISRGTVWVPHAVLVGDEVLSVYDPALHRASNGLVRDVLAGNEESSDHFPRAAHQAAPISAGIGLDLRWANVFRPFIVAGAAHERTGFEIRPNSVDRSLSAPLHLKAAHGTLVLDDSAARPRARRELVGCLSGGLERGADLLSLPDHSVVEVPLRYRLVLVDSRPPWKNGYHRLGARFGHQVPLVPLSVSTYRRAALLAANELGLRWDEQAFKFLISNLHKQRSIPLFASIPFELFRRIAEHAHWRAASRIIDSESLARAWAGLFGSAPRAVAP